MRNQYSLRIGFCSYIAGALIYFIFPDAQPLIFISASAAGAMAGTFITKTKQPNSLINLQVANQLNKTLTEWKPEVLNLKRNIMQRLNDMGYLLLERRSAYEYKFGITEKAKKERGFKRLPKDISQIIEWMATRSFVVENYRESQDNDPIYDRISLALAKQYDVLKPLHRLIKIHQQDGKEIYLNLAKKTPQEISTVTNFCTLLYNNSFLDNYRYISGRKLIRATTQSNPNMINFFTGDWFERYVFYQVNELLVGNGIEFSFLKSSRGTYANGQDFELDLIFFISGKPLWIECKSGQKYNSFLQKYSKYRKLMQIPKEQAFFIVADLSEEQAINYTNLWDITVVNIHNFVEVIGKVVTSER